MKIPNPIIWLSGADPEILDKCKKTNKSQRIKFAGFGTLVVIPAVVGLCSMTYALSTVTTDKRFYIGGGIIWSLIVLIIDRFIVATFHKSNVESSYTSYVISLVSRLVFAGFVGIAVSHPLTLLWFNESILNKIEENKSNAVTARRKQAQTEIAEIPKGSLSQDVKNKTDFRDCLIRLLTAEQAGNQVSLPCGDSSPRPTCGINCENIKKQIEQLNKEIDKANLIAGNEITRESNNIGRIEEAANTDINEIQRDYPDDYLARVNTLAQIDKEEQVKGNNHVWNVSWFLLWFFVFVDVLPVIMKFITPMGEYEYVRDTLLFDIQKTQEAEREAIRVHAESTLPGILAAKRRYDSKEDELTHLTDTTRQFLTEQEKIRVKFDEQFQEISNRVKKIKDEQVKAYYMDYLNRARSTFNLAWTKAYDKFHDFINDL